MPNPSNAVNPIDYPRYIRGSRPALPESLGQYVDDELEKLANSIENLAFALDAHIQALIADAIP